MTFTKAIINDSFLHQGFRVMKQCTFYYHFLYLWRASIGYRLDLTVSVVSVVFIVLHFYLDVSTHGALKELQDCKIYANHFQ